MRKIKIYLCGGLVTDWQEEVMDHFVGDEWNVEFYNPDDFMLGGSMGRPELGAYSPMDRLKIQGADIVFGYMEASNPTPINIALEMGYAKGLGKITILCNEWTPENFSQRTLKCLATSNSEVYATWFKAHYVDMLNDWMDFTEPDFGIAVEILKKIVKYEL